MVARSGFTCLALSLASAGGSLQRERDVVRFGLHGGAQAGRGETREFLVHDLCLRLRMVTSLIQWLHDEHLILPCWGAVVGLVRAEAEGPICVDLAASADIGRQLLRFKLDQPTGQLRDRASVRPDHFPPYRVGV